MDPLEGSSFVLSEMLKVEIEMKVEHQDLSNNAALHEFDDYTFPSSEVMCDPTSGLMYCRLCLEELPAEALGEHMVTVHKYRKVQFKCWICETTFKDRILLTIHRQTCQPKKKQKKTMQRLIKEAEQSDENVCPICFIEIPDDLKEHMIAEHSKKPTTPVVPPPVVEVNCPVCGKLFKSKVSMGQHVRLVHHSVQDSQECTMCGVRFSSYKYLANHIRNVHPTGNKVHKCDTCNKDFKSHQSLYQHKKNVHLGGYLRKREMLLNNSG